MKAAGACWYLLGVQRAAKCLKEQCRSATSNSCGLRLLSCKDPIFYGPNNMRMGRDRGRFDWANYRQSKFMCLDTADNFDYGAYKWTVQLVVNQSRLEKILFPIFWGLMTLRYLIRPLPFFFRYCIFISMHRLRLHISYRRKYSFKNI